jgi:hypothetical protein
MIRKYSLTSKNKIIQKDRSCYKGYKHQQTESKLHSLQLLTDITPVYAQSWSEISFNGTKGIPGFQHDRIKAQTCIYKRKLVHVGHN